MIQIDEQKLRQLFKNRSNCYADAEDVVQAMDEDCFIETVNEALRLFAVRQSLPSDVYTEIDIDKAYKCGERQSTFYKKNGTVILPRNYEGVDG